MIKCKDSSNQEVSEIKRGEYWEGSTETTDAEPLENEKEKKKRLHFFIKRSWVTFYKAILAEWWGDNMRNNGDLRWFGIKWEWKKCHTLDIDRLYYWSNICLQSTTPGSIVSSFKK